MTFTHLHVHSDYSPDGLSSVRELVLRAKSLGMKGIALTDHGTMAGVPEFVSKCEEEGIRPIIGYEFWITGNEPLPEDCTTRPKSFHLILLAKNLTGYRNLVKLCSIANGQWLIHGRPYITHEQLEQYHEGLICTSACIGGEIPQAILQKGYSDKPLEAARWYKDLFGDDFYLEVALHKPHGRTVLSKADNREAWRAANHSLVHKQMAVNEGLFAIAEQLGIKVVATNDVHFAGRDDAIAQDVLLCTYAGKKVSDPGRLRYSHQEYLKNEAEMRLLFPDHPEVIDNTMEVLSKIGDFSIWSPVRFPKVSDDPAGDLKALATEGARRRFGTVSKEVSERFDRELAAFASTGAEPLLLILKDLVDHAREQGIAVGPGRSSAPGSLVCYCLGITDVDPLKYGLLFERFVSPDRTSLPQIDIDFGKERRDELIAYLKARYGEDRIALVSTYGAWSKRTAWLATAEALNLSKEVVRKISQGMSYDDWFALQIDTRYRPELREILRDGGPIMKEAFDTASRLHHVHNGEDDIHACAVLIGADPLLELIPTAGTVLGTNVCQYDGWYVQDCGVLNQNILGLSALDAISETVRLVREDGGEDIDIEAIPLDDPQTLKVFSGGDTSSVFLFESEGLRGYLQQMEDLTFEDLVALNALYRPGPMEYLPEYVRRANGTQGSFNRMPEEEAILEGTHGMLVYQEQLMELAERVAGFTPADADRLRRAVGKKKRSLLEELQGRFLSGGIAHGHEKRQLEIAWEEWTRRGQGAFNRSHALCYTLISYRMAWLKAHYPEEFGRAVASVKD